MTTSGRSESINAFFDGYVNSNTMLSDFVMQHAKALASRRKKEEDEDFVTIDSCPILLIGHTIEQQVGKYYTRTIYELFKKEWQESFSYTHEKISKDVHLTNYTVGQHAVDKSLWRTVQYDASADLKVICSCAKFETHGILCKHILYLMRKRKLDAIPGHYILHRWTIGARYKAENSEQKFSTALGDYTVTPMNVLLVRKKFSTALENAKDCPAEIEDIGSYLDKLLDRQTKRRSSSTVATKDNINPCHADANSIINELHSHITIRDPSTSTKHKGRPKVATRKKSGLELATEIKKKKTCSLCGKQGHYRTGCHKHEVKDGGGKSRLNLQPASNLSKETDVIKE